MIKQLKKAYEKWIADLSAANNPLLLFYYRNLYKPRKDSLADYIDQYSKSQPKVKVLQIGANDGITHDPIHKFIKRNKWSGVLLEPLPDVFKNKLQKIYHLDKNIELVNKALGKEDGRATIYKVGFSDARWATGLTSFNKEVIIKAFNNGYVFKQALKEGLEVPADWNKRIVALEIDVVSVSTLLDQYRLEDINVLQIDTEGYDYEVLKMFNLKEIRPDLVIYENDHLSDHDKEESYRLLRNADYQIHHYGGNTLARYKQ